MVFVVGFRFGRTTCLALVQSTYSEESCSSQKRRSSCSFANSGKAFDGNFSRTGCGIISFGPESIFQLG